MSETNNCPICNRNPGVTSLTHKEGVGNEFIVKTTFTVYCKGYTVITKGLCLDEAHIHGMIASDTLPSVEEATKDWNKKVEEI